MMEMTAKEEEEEEEGNPRPQTLLGVGRRAINTTANRSSYGGVETESEPIFSERRKSLEEGDL